jgi:Transposase
MEVFCGIDWAEDHHDIALVNRDGQLLARRRISDDAAGLAQLLGLLAEHGDSAEDPVPVAIETPRGLLTACLRATGRSIYPSTRCRWPATGTGTAWQTANPTTATRWSWRMYRRPAASMCHAARDTRQHRRRLRSGGKAARERQGCMVGLRLRAALVPGSGVQAEQRSAGNPAPAQASIRR